ncbi:MAG: hypothetical protein A4E28_01703 [Methanocella sp. PtaU1.Bin125]|nr:MAG: hypothetical protein A4E28_01703 [Methanocella sp. PtaU1.Bin125]
MIVPFAIAAIAVVVIATVAALAIPAFSGPGAVPSAVDVPVKDTGNGTAVNASANDGIANVTDATPTPTPVPHRLRVVTGADATPAPDEFVQGPDTGASVIDGKSARHIAYAYHTGVNGIADYVAYWTVPRRPAYDGIQNHTIFLWTGIQQGDAGLIQAVLEWDHDHTGRYWTLACWIVNKRDGTYRVSPRVYDVYPGDRIRAELRYEEDAENPGCKVWHIIMTDETCGGTIELFDRGRAVDTNRDVILFSGVLEGIGYVYDPIDLPGDVTFFNMTYWDEAGRSMPVYLAGYVDPAFPGVAVEYEDREWGTPVTIYTDYTRPEASQ